MAKQINMQGEELPIGKAKPITIYPAPELHEKIIAAAAKDERSVSAFVLRMVRDALESDS